MKRLFPWIAPVLLTLGIAPRGAGGQATDAAKSAVLRGTAYDSVHHVPVSDATVVAIKADSPGSPSITQAHADARGAFEFTSLAPGRYSVSVESAALDSTELSIPDVERTLDPGTVSQLSLATPSRGTLVRLACGGAITDTTLGAVIGVVRDVTTGRPLPRALLALQWSDFNVDSTAHYHTHAKVASVTTDSSGMFRACGLPAQRSVFLQAQLGARNSGIVEEQITESGVLVRDFSLPADSTVRGYGTANITVRDPDGHPIPDAQVRLVGTTRSVPVRDDGRVHVDSLLLGTQQLQVIAVGYYPERRNVDVGDHLQRSLTITMEKLATVLESMRIVANANNPKYREFEQHRKQGWGDFYTEEDIAKRKIFDLSDFFTVLRHIDAQMSRSGHQSFTMSGQGFRGISTIMGGPAPPVGGVLAGKDSTLSGLFRAGPLGGMSACQPAVIVDGTPALAAGDYSGDALDAIPVSFVHAIEVYDGKYSPVPAQYRFGNGPQCGAIVIWTK